MLDAEGNEIKRPQIKLKATKIAICVPSRGECKFGFTSDLARLVNFTNKARPDINFGFNFGTHSILHDLRNVLARNVVDKVDYLMWFDDDMRFPPDALIRLLEHRKDIVGTNYVSRTMPPVPTAKFHSPDGNKFFNVPCDVDAQGLLEVDSCGFGCVLIRSEVFQKTPFPWFSMPYLPARETHVGEDTYFGAVARRAGFPTYIDQGLSREIKHVGSVEFTWLDHDQIAAHRAAQEQETGGETQDEQEQGNALGQSGSGESQEGPARVRAAG